MSSLFGLEASRAVQFAIAFGIILILLVLLGLVMRKVWGGRMMMSGNDRGRSRQPRLGIVDVYDLDRQRQLLLLRRDNVEHLLLIGGPNDVVIETNIVRVAGARIPAAANEPGAERYEPAFEPQVASSSGRPSIETQLAAQLGAFVRRPSEESDVDQELSAVASVSAPVQAHPEPVLRPDAVTVSAAPAVQPLRTETRAPGFTPPSAPPEPAVRPEPRPTFTPQAAPQPFQSRATPTASPPPAPPAPPVAPEPVRPPQPAPAEKTGPDAAVLSNMAKQLEEALKRPATPVPPPVVAPAPAAKPVVHDDVEDEDDLLEPGTDRNEPAEPLFDEEDLVEEPAPAPRQPEPPRPAVEPVRPAPAPVQPAQAQPAQAPAPAQAAQAQPVAAAPAAAAPAEKEADPFSVEDIEAEFARLLGRPLDPGKKG